MQNIKTGPGSVSGSISRGRTRDFAVPVASSISRELLIVSSLVIVGSLVRLICIRFSPSIDGDGVWYATLGARLVRGDFEHGLSTYWPPLYPFLIGIVSLFTSDLELAGRFVSAFAGGLLIVPTYFLCRQVFDKKTALIAGCLVLVNPLLIKYSTVIMTESTYVLFFTSAMLFGLRAISSQKRFIYVVAGAAFGCCYLIRPEAIGFPALFLVILALTYWRFSSSERKRVLISGALFLVAFLTFAIPYIVYIHHQSGRWMISQKFSDNLSDSESNWRKLVPQGDATRADITWAGYRSASPNRTPQVGESYGHAERSDQGRIGGIFSLLKGAITRSVKGFVGESQMLPQLVPAFFLILCGLALFATRWTKHDLRSHMFLLSFIGAGFVGYSITFLQLRYLLPFLPIFLCWAAKGFVNLRKFLSETGPVLPRWFNRSRVPRLFAHACIIILLLFAPASDLIALVKVDVDQPRAVANWFKIAGARNSVIMSSSPWAAFISGGQHIYLPDEEFSVTLDYARKKHANFIMIEESEIGKTAKLKFLLDEKNSHTGLSLVYAFDNARAPRIMVYAVDPAPQ